MINELGDDLSLLVPREEVGDEAGRGQNVIHVLQEALFLDVLIGEEECRALALDPARAVQHLEVLEEVVDIVGPGHRHLESLVS